MPNKLSRFWQELKGRKVIHVIALYAGATFVIIELVNNIFDVTPEGIERTKPAEEYQEDKNQPSQATGGLPPMSVL